MNDYTSDGFSCQEGLIKSFRFYQKLLPPLDRAVRMCYTVCQKGNGVFPFFARRCLFVFSCGEKILKKSGMRPAVY